MSEDDKVRSDLITQLLCNFKLPLAAFESRHHIRFDDYFREERPALENLQREGLLKVSPDVLEVSDQGRFFVRNIAMVFDAYLKKPRTEDRPLYSQTV
jgi:oxygen-independent coproporphyrinogen-3 oxidase